MDFKKYNSIVFDCDGVLINSNKIKSDAFYELGKFAGNEVAQKLRDYHIINGGISRYEKIKFLYLELLKKNISDSEMRLEAKRYGSILLEKILKADTAIGLDILRKRNKLAIWSVVSGGDQEELQKIFKINKLEKYFCKNIFGSPRNKFEIIDDEKTKNCFRQPTIFIGDSKYDYEVAKKYDFDFIYLSDWSEWKPQFSDKIKYRFKSIEDLSKKI